MFWTTTIIVIISVMICSFSFFVTSKGFDANGSLPFPISRRNRAVPSYISRPSLSVEPWSPNWFSIFFLSQVLVCNCMTRQIPGSYSDPSALWSSSQNWNNTSLTSSGEYFTKTNILLALKSPSFVRINPSLYWILCTFISTFILQLL